MIFKQLKGNPGVRRVHAELASLGHRVARKRVWRLMKQLGLQGRHPRAWKKTTIHGDKPVPAPDLIGRNFTARKRISVGAGISPTSNRGRAGCIWPP